MTPETFRACAEQAGYDIRSYSGRGMYGRQCMAIDTDENGGAIYASDLPRLGGSIALFAVNTYGVDHDEALDILSSCLVDSMGYGLVIYWPALDWDNGADSSADAGDAPEDLR